MNLTLYQRDFTRLAVQPPVAFTVGPYTRGVIGGPEEVTVQARGEPAELFRLINHLRAPVEVKNEKGDLVWYGMLRAVLVSASTFEFGVDIDTMSNRVAVAYTDQNIRYTTEWSADAESVAMYGIKEILLSRSDATAADALQMRDTHLAAARLPGRVLEFLASVAAGEAAEAEVVASLTCVGWLETLNWQHYTNLTGKEAFEAAGEGGREIGEDDRPILAQSFQIAASEAWAASAIWLMPWRQGKNLAADNLVVSLRADAGGNPGAVLASAQRPGAEIGTQAEWTEFPLSAAVTLQPGTTYWIHVARSGGVDEEAYFMVDTNRAGTYPRGSIKLWNTNVNAWVTEPMYSGDLLFSVVGSAETTAQIATLVASCGQFFTGAMLETESGVQSNPFRSGDTVALYELLKLLSAGTAASRRLLAEVTPARQLRVYEEPARPARVRDSYALDQAGKLWAAAGTPVDLSLCPVGIWCHLADVIPPTVDLSMVAEPSLFFIEEAEYDPGAGTYKILRTSEQADVLDLGGVVQG